MKFWISLVRVGREPYWALLELDLVYINCCEGPQRGLPFGTWGKNLSKGTAGSYQTKLRFCTRDSPLPVFLLPT